MSINERFNKNKYDILPVDSGADSFISIEWKFRISEATGFASEVEIIDKTTSLMALFFEAIVKELGDGWLISHPIYGLKVSFDEAFLRVNMRKKSFYAEINQLED
jgi:hypothetical protein